MSKEETRYFWNKTGECFAGKVVGDDITDYFPNDIGEKGEVIKGSRLDKYIELGNISEVKPECYEAAEDAELNKLRETVKSQKIEIADLKNDLGSVPKNITASRKEVKGLKSELVEKDLEIEELQKQIKNIPKDAGESAKKIDDLEKKIIDFDISLDNVNSEKEGLSDQIVDLTKTIEELTAPKGKGGK